MTDSAHSIVRLARQMVTWGAFSLIPAMFAASGPPTVTVQGEVTVKGPVEVQGSVEVLNDALKVPYNRRIQLTLPNGISSFDGSLSGIPAGKRLVIETIGVRVRGEPGQRIAVQVGGGGVASTDTYYLPVPISDHGEIGTRQTFHGLHAVKMIMDPRLLTGLICSVGRSASTGTVDIFFTLCGYLEDLPATPPAP